jgi:hypothetical protein
MLLLLPLQPTGDHAKRVRGKGKSGTVVEFDDDAGGGDIEAGTSAKSSKEGGKSKKYKDEELAAGTFLIVFI